MVLLQLTKMNAKYDAILSALSSIQATLGYLVKSKSDQVRHSNQLHRSLTEHQRLLSTWRDSMRHLEHYLEYGDHNIVLDGAPGVWMKGRFTSKKMYLTCLGKLPTFCRMKSRNAVMKVQESKDGFRPLAGRKW